MECECGFECQDLPKFVEHTKNYPVVRPTVVCRPKQLQNSRIEISTRNLDRLEAELTPEKRAGDREADIRDSMVSEVMET